MRKSVTFVLILKCPMTHQPIKVLMLPIASGMAGGGQLAMPGGYLDRGETHEEAALRKAVMETGLRFDVQYGPGRGKRPLTEVYRTRCGAHRTFLMTTYSKWDRKVDAKHTHIKTGAPSHNECENWLTKDRKFPADWVSIAELRKDKGVTVPRAVGYDWRFIKLWDFAKISLNGALKHLKEPLIE